MPGELSKPSPKPRENVLYVVFHGLITLIDEGPGKGFIAHLLEIGTEHKYLLGDWLSERDVPDRKPGKYPHRSQLLGVDSFPRRPGKNTLDPDKNAVGKIKTIPSDMSCHVKAVIRLPRPRKIWPFVVGKLPQGGLSGTSGLVKPPTFLSGTQVFEYTFKIQNNVRLKPEHGKDLWTPSVAADVDIGGKSLAVIVLHVYDEPPLDMGKQASAHNKHEFGMSASFLNSNAALVKPAIRPATIRKKDVPPGLLRGELVNLHRRTKAVTRILLNIREGEVTPHDVGGGSSGPVCGGMHAQTT